MNYFRFKDEEENIKYDYIIFLFKDYVSVDVKVSTPTKSFDFARDFDIYENRINWGISEYDIMTDALQNYCNKLVLLKSFI